MEALLILIPILLVLVVLFALIRQRAAKRITLRPPSQGPGRAHPTGVREPRHPRGPLGASSAAVPLPEERPEPLEAVGHSLPAAEEETARRGVA